MWYAKHFVSLLLQEIFNKVMFQWIFWRSTLKLSWHVTNISGRFPLFRFFILFNWTQVKNGAEWSNIDISKKLSDTYFSFSLGGTGGPYDEPWLKSHSCKLSVTTTIYWALFLLRLFTIQNTSILFSEKKSHLFHKIKSSFYYNNFLFWSSSSY